MNGAGTCANVQSNTITGIGPTDILAQNGIQISRGATAIVQGNTISNNVYTDTSVAVSTGILLFEDGSAPPQPVCVQGNTVFSNNLGMALSGRVGTLVQQNTITDNTDIGIFVDNTSSGNVFVQNIVTGSGLVDIDDESVGFFSGMTANIYLCNTCNTDNREGAICSSTGAFIADLSPISHIMRHIPHISIHIHMSPE